MPLSGHCGGASDHKFLWISALQGEDHRVMAKKIHNLLGMRHLMIVLSLQDPQEAVPHLNDIE